MDGVEFGRRTGIATTPGSISNGVTSENYLGRSLWTADKTLHGSMRDFRIYDRAVNIAKVDALAQTVTDDFVATDTASLDLGDLSRVVSALTLPTEGANGTTIEWESSNLDVIATDGSVKRVSTDTTVTLTATVNRGASSATKTFTATVPKSRGADQDEADILFTALPVVGLDDVRSNINLPTTASDGTVISWSSSAPSVITPTGVVTRPAHGEGGEQLTLTASLVLNGKTLTHEYAATVSEMPEEEDAYGYLMAHFVEDANGYAEKIYFDLGRGEDPTKWDKLNNGEPILMSNLGTIGVRDPYLIRSPEGDKFYLFATDLRVFGGVGDWGDWGSHGSRSLLVWESTDLKNWSDTRLVEVAPENAGMAWAPEAIWDEDKGEYVVFWASELYDQATDPAHTRPTGAKIMYATTRDFGTFSPAKIYIDAERGAIDTTMIEHDGKIYRFSKDNSSVSKQLYSEMGSGIFADDFRVLTDHIGEDLYGTVEGPLIFKDNYKERWYLFIDQYAGPEQGYRPFTTTDLNTTVWTPLPKSEFEQAANTKHGVVLPLKVSEYESLADPTVGSVDSVAVETEAGTAPALPATVDFNLTPDIVRERAVTWDGIDSAQYANEGTFEVSGAIAGTLIRVAATVTVTAAPIEPGDADGDADGVGGGDSSSTGGGKPSDGNATDKNPVTPSALAQTGSSLGGALGGGILVLGLGACSLILARRRRKETT